MLENYIVEPQDTSDEQSYICMGSKQEYIEAFPHLEYINKDFLALKIDWKCYMAIWELAFYKTHVL